ncbi:MAG: hypothetical protein A2934_02145 [Candidatus Sungbacteria bacterium RIFCSPLOWO2_01_FULL_47_10]|uniref:Uncharacterized protein n=1 Tax=Candidatus Sungbacteria bacterium RIFCSPLOWO2_01_FULL_47_10 TaxID=1802276 RepID=A0A1G2KYD3_9BACT|nr:MAG: hypothetical protein A2934_02145 [Candidatus Sungbacteria bacterium RIFCSPLOWO2_01_FULL_47_10]
MPKNEEFSKPEAGEGLKDRYAALTRAYWADVFNRIELAPESFKDALEERDALIASGVSDEEANQSQAFLGAKHKTVSHVWEEMGSIEKQLDMNTVAEIHEKIKEELKKSL